MVTILILIDGFLQSKKEDRDIKSYDCHNPYFNRWFSAIMLSDVNKFAKTLSQSLF